jgi:DNA uptake protein ComE-like DNA-binding protein
MTLLLSLLIACGAQDVTLEPTEPVVAPTPAPPPAPPAPATTGSAKVNVNTASDAELKAAVPGLGDKMAHEFEEYRPYVSITQFRKEMGKYVDAATIESYEQFVYVPVDPNACDAATLIQLPGVDPAAADALIAKRPFADHAAFLAMLGETASADDVATAKGMLTP